MAGSRQVEIVLLGLDDKNSRQLASTTTKQQLLFGNDTWLTICDAVHNNDGLPFPNNLYTMMTVQELHE